MSTLYSSLPSPERLTDRELEVLQLAAAGKTNREIAHDLVIVPRTVEQHMAHINKKLGVKNRTQAALYAVRMGIVDEGPEEQEAEEPEDILKW